MAISRDRYEKVNVSPDIGICRNNVTIITDPFRYRSQSVRFPVVLAYGPEFGRPAGRINVQSGAYASSTGVGVHGGQ